jgi:hypothetical protein
MSRDVPGIDPTGQGDSSNELSGNIFGPNVQARTIHGDVHLYNESRERPPAPRQLPAPPPHFTNRRAELAQLDDIHAMGLPGLVILTGQGGIGKTALATQWAHRTQAHFPDGQLYIDLGGFGGGPPVDPAEVLGSFLRALGVDPANVPVTLAEQVTLYRSVTAGQAILIVLDNAMSAAQVRVLVPAGTPSMVVVTSRSRLIGLLPDGAQLIEVAPLPAADSVALLTRTIGSARIAREQDRTADLVGICAGLPIALCVAAARLASRPRLSVGKVVSELADETSRLRRLSISDGPSVQAVLDASYRFLDPRAATLYRRLSLHPGREFGIGPVAAVTPDPHTEARGDPVDRLLEASLLQEVAEDRFRFHDLVRLHAKQKAQSDDNEQDRETAVLAILEWYLAAAQLSDQVLTPYRRRLVYQPTTTPHSLPALASRDVALGWLGRERVNLIAAGRAALDYGYAELAWHLSDVMWPLFLFQKHYRDRIDTDRRGIAAARQWENRWAEARMLKRLSRVCTTARDYEAAERYARESISRYEEVGDARGILEAQESLALLYRDSGREELAATALAGLLDANRRLGAERSTGLMMINLGVLLTTLGRAAEAVPMLREAKELFAKLSDIDPYNEARATIGLSGAYLNTGELSQAEDMATAAARRMDELGSAHEKAEALSLLGKIAQRRGDVATACAHFLSALDIFNALGSSRATNLRDQVTRLGCL